MLTFIKIPDPKFSPTMPDQVATTVNPLLKHLHAWQIQDLIHEIEHIEPHFQLHYVIDPFDFEEYCFPMGLSYNENAQKNVVKAADDTLGRHHIFDDPQTKLLLFNEYFDEFSDFELLARREADSAIQAATKMFSDTFDWIDVGQDRRKLMETIEVSIPLAMSVFLHDVGLKKLYQLRKTQRLLEDEHRKPSEGFSEEAWNFIRETACDPKTMRPILELLIRELRIPPHVLDDLRGVPFEYRRQLRNKNRDSKAIDRLLHINQHLHRLQPAGQDRGILLAYMSSVAATRTLFGAEFMRNRFVKVTPDVYFNPCRTAEQLFLMHLCRQKTAEDTLELLKVIYGYRLSQQDGMPPPPAIRERLEKFLPQLEEKLKADKNRLLFEQIEHYKTEIENLAEIGKIGKLREHLQKLQELAQEIKQQPFNVLDYDRRFLAMLAAGITRLSNEKYLMPSFGDDHVKGLYQRLPLVFFSQELSAQTATLRSLVNFVIKSIHPQPGLQSFDFILTIAQNLLNLEVASLDLDLSRCLLLLLFPKPAAADLVNDNNADFVVFNYVTQKIEAASDSDSRLDLLCMAAWTARRLTLYDQAVQFSNEGLAQAPDDPRFYQSLGLINYCRSFDLGKKEQHLKLPYLEKALEATRQAFEKYEALDGAQAQNLAVPKIKSAVLNTRIYIKCLLYEITNQEDYIEKNAAQLIENLEKMVGGNFEDLPDFLHTKAHYEYCRAHLFWKNNQFDRAEKRLDEAEEYLAKMKNNAAEPRENDEHSNLRQKIDILRDEVKKGKSLLNSTWF